MDNIVFCATQAGQQLLKKTIFFLGKQYDIPKEKLSVVEFERVDFANSEFKIVGKGNLRDKKVHLFTSIKQESPNICVAEDVMELLLMADAIQRAGAIELIIYFGYLPFQRQEKKKPKEPISARLLFNLIEAAASDIIKRYGAVGLHEDAIQGFTNLPFDVIRTLPLHVLSFKTLLPQRPFIAVSNDEGKADMIREFAYLVGAQGSIIMKKRRDGNNDPKTNVLEGSGFLTECDTFVIGDDEISSGDSLINTCNVIRAKNPRAKIYGFADHGLFNLKAGRFAEEKFYSLDIPISITDTIPRTQDYYDSSHKWLKRVVTVAPYLADLVWCNIKARSFSAKCIKHIEDVQKGTIKIEDYSILQI